MRSAKRSVLLLSIVSLAACSAADSFTAPAPVDASTASCTNPLDPASFRLMVKHPSGMTDTLARQPNRYVWPLGNTDTIRTHTVDGRPVLGVVRYPVGHCVTLLDSIALHPGVSLGYVP